MNHIYNQLQEYEAIIRKNHIDLYQFSYQTRMKNVRKIVISSQSQVNKIIDEVRTYLINETEKRQLLQFSFMDQDKREALKREVKNYIQANEKVVPGISAEELLEFIMHELTGFGIIQPLIEREEITDIFINGRKEIRYIDVNGKEHKYNSKMETEEELLGLAYKITNTAGEAFSTAKPYAECSFPFIRISISKGDISGLGTSITIRKAAPYLRATEERLISTGQATKEMLDLMEAAVKADCTILICGPTGCGKTEFMKYMAGFIPDDERTLVIEDDPELFLELLYPEKHIFSKHGRRTEDKNNNIDLAKLMKLGLREFPKRLILGESRGAEAWDMIEFFNTGHGGYTGIHAPSARRAVKRLVQMCQRADENLMSEHTLYSIIMDVFDLIVVLNSFEGQRYIVEISEPIGYENGNVMMNHIFKLNEGKHQQIGYISEELLQKFKNRNIPKHLYESLISPNREVIGVV
ncbi:ATPase, T2SS/T4P/T4SS family [Anoxybacillus rupiensis]|uniref:ATPase, T2SS/T4P/T4SS family n=1 Tax=Anoxybacteroides rupiense TaxID=311460 RepID=A0ABD5IWI3_9BACL|nr:ATPase, T2SS/T4P/T4SS family [Anoxybacillus rupiensis]